MTSFKGTLLLTRSELASLLDTQAYIEGIEQAFRGHGEGAAFGTGMLHGDTPGELEFHIKSGGLAFEGARYYGLKINASAFVNRERFGLPNIMGAIVLFDGEKGLPLAVLDSIDPTLKRTGAGTAVAAKYLARPDAATLTVCGCGNQGRVQLRFLKAVLPIRRVWAFDRDPALAKAYAETMTRELDLEVRAAVDLAAAVGQSDVIVTCTPSRKPLLSKEAVKPGTFVAAIGADSPDKQELETSFFRETKVVVDILAQCAVAGELHHALTDGVLTREDVHAEIGQIVAGRKPGRESAEEIIVYDATGTALQDTAAAALCYRKAVAAGIGRYVNFFD